MSSAGDYNGDNNGDNNGDEKLEASFCRLALTCHLFKNMLEEKMTLSMCRNVGICVY